MTITFPASRKFSERRKRKVTLVKSLDPRWRRRFGLAVSLAAVGALVPWLATSAAAGASPGHGRSPGHWVATWGASPQEAVSGALSATGFDNQTIRNIVFTSVGGNAVRLELTNTFGATPLTIGRVTVGVAGSGAAVVPGTIHVVRFGGSTSIQIPPGAQVLSDPVAMNVKPLQELALSVYVPDATGPATNHSDAQQVNYVSTAGDHAGQLSGAAFTTQSQSWYYVDAVSVRSTRAAGTVVAFGDSITDGFHSTVGANARWPNDLARRLVAHSGRTLAVADEGISGDRVLNSDECCGVDALSRFDRDALSQPGVRDIIVLEGINDIGWSDLPPNPLTDPNTSVSAAQIIAGYKQLIAYAHQNGLKIFGATLTPFKGSAYYTAAGERKREIINHWIRTSGAFNGVIDFDKVVRDPSDPLIINPIYDSGDHLHPNDAGYQAMANAVSLAMLLHG
jgi:lysophospholipase L1-like esterase